MIIEFTQEELDLMTLIDKQMEDTQSESTANINGPGGKQTTRRLY